MKKFSFGDRLKSFVYAWDGIKAVLKTEHNTWIHLFLTTMAIVAGFFLKIERLEWMALLIVISFVWMAELFNTCLEKVMDFLSLEKHPQIKLIKDMAAAAVLIASLAAIAVGCLIFIPKFF